MHLWILNFQKFHCFTMHLFQLAKTGHTMGVGGFSCIKSTISSVNHGCEIKMITVSP